MESKRQQKFNSLLQRDLSGIFLKEMSRQFGDAFITITGVQISPDLGLAKVYISAFMVEDKIQFMNLVNQKKSEIRKHLGFKIGKQVRRIPELIFVLDEGADHASKIDQILSKLDIPSDDGDDKPAT